MHYCIDCTWRTSTGEQRNEYDSNRQAIDHYVTTGHTVVHHSIDRNPDIKSEDRTNVDCSARLRFLAAERPFGKVSDRP